MTEGSAKAPRKEPEKGTAKPRKFQAIKGTRDLLPPETALWNRVEQTAHEVFATYGFGEIRLPIFEPTELFARAVGGETDIVSKEMYTFEDHDFSELDKLRTILLFRSPDIYNPHSISLYKNQLIEFLNAFEAGLSKSDIPIPGTPNNLRALENLRMHLARIDFVLQDFKSGTPQALARFDLQVDGIREALRVIGFGDVISLRPEVTASVCRAYIEHGMHTLPQPVKLYCMGPMFRRERPQKGRYRQFYQIDAEVLEATRKEVASGEWRVASKELEKDAAIDAEIIEMLMTFFDKIGLQGAKLYINSIGDRNCRPKYVELLRSELQKVRDRLGPDSQRRIETNPLRVLDSKLESEQAIIEKLPHISEHLCDDCAKNYEDVKRELTLRDIQFQENWRLVRGLDYYMRTTFEITAPGLGSQNAICGGGRYDGLVELLGGPPTKGTGFAIGEDRLILSLQEARKEVASGEWRVASGKIGCDVYLAWMGEKAYATAIRAAKTLRAAGFSVELPPAEQKFGRALSQADKLGARYALILGEDEIASGQWTVKRLADGHQSKLTETDFLKLLKREQSLSS